MEGGVYIGGMQTPHPWRVPTLVLVLFLVSALPLGAKNARRLTLRDLEGNKARMSEQQGKVVVLNFWATWCGPCQEEIPRLGRMSEQYAGQNVAFVLASIDEQNNVPAVRDYVREHKINLAVWTGASVDLLEDLAGVNVVPATLILDQKGDIIRAINGEAREEDIREVVDWLLKGRKGSPPSDRVKRY